MERVPCTESYYWSCSALFKIKYRTAELVRVTLPSTRRAGGVLPWVLHCCCIWSGTGWSRAECRSAHCCGWRRKKYWIYKQKGVKPGIVQHKIRAQKVDWNNWKSSGCLDRPSLVQGTEIPVVCLKLRFNNWLNDCLVVVVFLIVSDPSHRQVKLGYKRIRGNDPPPIQCSSFCSYRVLYCSAHMRAD